MPAVSRDCRVKKRDSRKGGKVAWGLVTFCGFSLWVGMTEGRHSIDETTTCLGFDNMKVSSSITGVLLADGAVQCFFVRLTTLLRVLPLHFTLALGY